MFTYIHIYICMYVYIYIYIYICGLSGVHKGGFSTGGFSSSNTIIARKLLNTLY